MDSKWTDVFIILQDHLLKENSFIYSDERWWGRILFKIGLGVDELFHGIRAYLCQIYFCSHVYLKILVTTFFTCQVWINHHRLIGCHTEQDQDFYFLVNPSLKQMSISRTRISIRIYKGRSEDAIYNEWFNETLFSF